MFNKLKIFYLKKNSTYNLTLIFILIFFIIIRTKYLNFIPFWDGGIFYNCLEKSITTGFNFQYLNCYRHLSFVYMLLFAIPFYFFKKVFFLHLLLTVLGVISIIVFSQLLNIFCKRDLKFEKALMTFIFAFHPALLSCSINFNLDYGILIFFLFYLYFLLKRKMVYSVIVSLLLLFTKETAFLIVGVTLFLYLINQCAANFSFINIKKIIKQNFILFIPQAIYIVVYFIRSKVYATQFLNSDQIISFIFSTNTFSYLYAGLFLIFGFNFMWFISILNFIIIVFYLKKDKYFIFLITLLIALVFIVTLIKSHINVRYFIVTYPIQLFITALFLPRTNILFRRLFLIIICIFFFIANYLSVDPVSKHVFHTFKFGNYNIYKMTSVTGEPNGFGRDQLVYNLQFTNWFYIFDLIFQDIKPDKKTTFVINDEADWYIVNRIDSSTYVQTSNILNSFHPRIIGALKLIKTKELPSKVYFVALPNFINLYHINYLSKYYSIIGSKNYKYNKYITLVYEMEKK